MTKAAAIASFWGALALGAAPFWAPVALAEQPSAPVRTLSVSGEAEIKAVPDEAVLTAGVESQAKSAEDALAANRQAMDEVLAALKRQGIPERSVQTSNFSVSPQYDSGKDDGAAPRLAGYRVTNSVTVTLDDLSKAGPVIDSLVAAGANTMGGIAFTIRDPQPLQKKARAAAVKDAIDRAETYAAAAGVGLGRVTTIDEGEKQAIMPVFRALALAPGAQQPTPIAPGEQAVAARITMTFEIK